MTDVEVISSNHVSGQVLDLSTGILGFGRYPGVPGQPVQKTLEKRLATNSGDTILSDYLKHMVTRLSNWWILKIFNTGN